MNVSDTILWLKQLSFDKAIEIVDDTSKREYSNSTKISYLNSIKKIYGAFPCLCENKEMVSKLRNEENALRLFNSVEAGKICFDLELFRKNIEKKTFSREFTLETFYANKKLLYLALQACMPPQRNICLRQLRITDKMEKQDHDLHLHNLMCDERQPICLSNYLIFENGYLIFVRNYIKSKSYRACWNKNKVHRMCITSPILRRLTKWFLAYQKYMKMNAYNIFSDRAAQIQTWLIDEAIAQKIDVTVGNCNVNLSNRMFRASYAILRLHQHSKNYMSKTDVFKCNRSELAKDCLDLAHTLDVHITKYISKQHTHFEYDQDIQLYPIFT